MYRGPGPGRGARKAGEALAGRMAASASPGAQDGVADVVAQAVVDAAAEAAAEAVADAVARGALREGNSSRHRVICHTRVVKFPSSVAGEDTQNQYDSPTSPGARHEAFDDRRPLDGTPAGRPGA
jgi:hypothetical protein